MTKDLFLKPQDLKRAYKKGKISSKEFEEKLYHLALKYRRKLERDVTGAFSRLFFEDIIKIEHSRLARNPELKMSLVILDIDYFKKFNDKYGHPAGDKLLNKLANLLIKGLRKGDIVCRYGGEEFVMILTGTGLEEAKEVAERLRKKIEKVLKITASMGISQDNPEKSIAQLIGQADQALYKAKKAGRNRVCLSV